MSRQFTFNTFAKDAENDHPVDGFYQTQWKNLIRQKRHEILGALKFYRAYYRKHFYEAAMICEKVLMEAPPAAVDSIRQHTNEATRSRVAQILMEMIDKFAGEENNHLYEIDSSLCDDLELIDVLPYAAKIASLMKNPIGEVPFEVGADRTEMIYFILWKTYTLQNPGNKARNERGFTGSQETFRQWHHSASDALDVRGFPRSNETRGFESSDRTQNPWS